MRFLIRSAKTSLHIEQQMFVSNDRTWNRVARTLVERVVRAVREHAPFSVVLLTNAYNDDEGAVLQTALYMLLRWSVGWMEEYAVTQGISRSQLYEHLFVGYLECPRGTPGTAPHAHAHVKLHSNIVIADSRRAVRSSSNMTDRSLSDKPCDTELSMLITDARAIRGLQNKLWARYLATDVQTSAMRDVPVHSIGTPITHDAGDTETVPDMHRVFKACRSGTGLVRPLSAARFTGTNMLPKSVLAVMMRALHRDASFGAREKIKWKVCGVRSVREAKRHVKRHVKRQHNGTKE
jgi:hypothetical protein